jgi:hypothetical protein
MQHDSLRHRADAALALPQWLVRAVAVAVGVVLLALSAPIIWAALAAGIGLAGLLALGLAGTLVFQALPWAMQRLENGLLKLRKAEARSNPIEQLQNEVLRRAERLGAFRQALVRVGAQIESIAQMVQQRCQRDPAHVLERQERALQRLKQFHELNLARLMQAQAALEDFRHKVDQKHSEWEIALAIDETSKALDPNATEHLLQNLLTDTALRTVQDRFNAVFCELDVQMRSLDAPTHELFAGRGMERLDALNLCSAADKRETP